MSRAEQVDADLETLYAKVPEVGCKGLCVDACGPVDGGPRELVRMARAGVKLPPREIAIRKMASTPENYECPALVNGRCSTYQARPMVCFLPGAWIYSALGPKRIEEIFAGDLVYGADGALHKVLATNSRVYTGQIINVRHTGTHVPCWSTADHLWLVARHKDRRKRPRPDWRPANDLIPKRQHQAGDYLCYPRAFQETNQAEHLDVAAFVQGRRDGNYILPFTRGGRPVRGIVQRVPAQIRIDDDFLFLLGIFLAEGNASIQSATFTMHADERFILERIGKYLDSLGVTSHTLRVVRRTSSLCVHSALFGRLMKSLCGVGAAGKRLHPSLFELLSPSQLWQVYEAWDVGDGRKSKGEREMSTTTNSERLAVHMGFIALRNGLFPRTYITNRSQRGGPSYTLYLYPSNWRNAKPGHGTKLMYDEHLVYTPAVGNGGQYRNEPTEIRRDYEGPVFDLQIEDAESFVTSSGIAHNCRIWGASEDLVCPYGCRPAPGERLLTSAETMHLLDAATKAGTPDEPLAVDEWEKALNRPGARAWLRNFIPTPEATRPVPRKIRRAAGDPS